MNNIPSNAPQPLTQQAYIVGGKVSFAHAMKFGVAAYCGVLAVKCAVGAVAGTTAVAIALAGGYEYEDKTKRKD